MSRCKLLFQLNLFLYGSKSGLFETKPLFDHSKSRLVWISDPRCNNKVILIFSVKILKFNGNKRKCRHYTSQDKSYNYLGLLGSKVGQSSRCTGQTFTRTHNKFWSSHIRFNDLELDTSILCSNLDHVGSGCALSASQNWSSLISFCGFWCGFDLDGSHRYWCRDDFNCRNCNTEF